MSALAVGGFSEILGWVEKKAPLRRNVEGKDVGDASAERQFRTDDGEVDLLPTRDRLDGMRIGRIDRNTACQAADSGVSRRADDLGHVAFGRQFPNQGVFAPPVSDDQNSRETHVS